VSTDKKPAFPWRAVQVNGKGYEHLVNVISDEPNAHGNTFTAIVGMLAKDYWFTQWLLEAESREKETDRLRAEVERLRTSWREDMDRIAAAVAYPPGANYGDILGKIDELRAENERLTRELSECGATLAERWTPADDALMGALVREKELRAEVERLTAGIERIVNEHCGALDGSDPSKYDEATEAMCDDLQKLLSTLSESKGQQP
jgi:hypothetical protein